MPYLRRATLAAGDRSREPRDRRRSALARACDLRLAIAATALLGLGLSSLAAPEDAGAKVPVVGDVLGTVTGGIGDAATGIFKSLVSWLFGGIQAQVTKSLISYLVALPNFRGGNVGELSHTTSAIAFGLIGAVMTFSIARYYLAGMSLSGAGGYEAFEGVIRTVGAAMFIMVWPFLFDQLVALANTASAAVMQSHGVADDVTRLFRATFTVTVLSGVGPLIGIVIALAGTFLLLGLLLMKVVMSAALAVLFVGMPIAVVLWPIAGLSWIARFAARGLTVILLAPLLWALVFAAFAAIGVDALSLRGGGGAIDKAIVKPLTAIALLYAAITLPRLLMRAAMLGAHDGPGFVLRTGSYMAGRAGYERLGGAIAAGPGKQVSGTAFGTSGGDQGRPPGSAPGGQGRAPKIAGELALGNTAAGGAAAAGAGAGAVPGGPRPSAPAEGGLPQVAWERGARERFAQEMSGAGARARDPERRPDAEQVRKAIGRLAPHEQRDVGRIAAHEPAGFQKRMAEQASAAGVGDERRESFRTLAASFGDAREEGIRAALSTLQQAPGSSAPSASAPAEQPTRTLGDVSGKPHNPAAAGDAGTPPARSQGGPTEGES